MLGILSAAAMLVPLVVDQGVIGNDRWTRYAYDAWGLAWIFGSIGVFAVMVRKEARLECGDKSADTEVHASFVTLLVLVVGMLLYGLAFVAPLSDKNSHFDGLLSVIGSALIAYSVVSYFDHLAIRIGRTAAALTIIGIAIWAAKNFTRVFTNWMTDPDAARFLVFGI